ncbi:MAG TPA: hypothetical protein PK514_02520 [Spirochaetota bacterium]|nr:hypothetical protein [Spirochaetota bacterium]
MKLIHRTFNGIKDPLIISDLFSETIGGGSNTVCALGNSRLTAGISPWAEIVYFRWPDLSKYDHLRYVSKNYHILHGLVNVKNMRYGIDAPCTDWRKYGRPYEKYKGLGACGGLYSAQGGMTWQDQPYWKSSRRYLPEWSHMLETRLVTDEKSGKGRAEMVISQWVMPGTDILVQHYSIDAAGYDAFFYHAVFAPWMTNPAGFHNPDSRKAGFGAVYCVEDEIMLWMYPGDTDRRRFADGFSRIMNIHDAQGLCRGKGIFIAMACSEPVSEFQAGADRVGRFSLKKFPAAGRADAEDCCLENNMRQRGPVDGAIKIPLSGGSGEVTVFVAVAESPEKSAALVKDAKLKGHAWLKKQALPEWERVKSGVYIPQGIDSAYVNAAQRSITNLLLGQDKQTGAIAASPVRQPRYCCDWPRDGAFFDLALDFAGMRESVDRHLLFYKNTQRKERTAFTIAKLLSLQPPFYSPRGHWYSNMNCDGSPGSLKIIPFEIDETSLLVWDIWRHRKYIPPEQADEYRAQFSGTLLLAMNAILPFVDRKRGWLTKAFEDDDYKLKATFHGASAVLTALACGADLAEKWGIDSSLRENCLSAAAALKKGMLKRVNDPEALEQTGWRGIQWSLFPSPLFSGSGAGQCLPLLKRLAYDMRRKALSKCGGVGYLGEQLFTFAASTPGIKEYNELKEDILRVLVSDVPVEGTGSYGEVGLWIESEGKKIIQNRTSIPHLWSGATVYLAILAVREPYLFQQLRPPLPL